MRTTMRVIQGRLAESESHRTSAIEAAYQHFRLDKQGSLVSPKTLQHYEWTIRPFGRTKMVITRRTITKIASVMPIEGSTRPTKPPTATPGAIAKM